MTQRAHRGVVQVDSENGGKFDCKSSVDMTPFLGKGTLPCNLRMYPEQEGRAITPDLAGPVGVLDKNNDVISVVNVSVRLSPLQSARDPAREMSLT
eukprot:SAG11_NODE_5327_length_1594_cov_2.701713_2_plen_96_part_00